MIAHATFRERLPSAVAAIALQVGMLALLALSFQVVRQIGQEKESILTLPPLAQPRSQLRQVAPTPHRNPSTTTAPPPPAVSAAPPPAWALPGFTLGSGGAGAGLRLAQPPGLDACRPENYISLNATDRAACSRASEMARRDPNVLPLDPNKPVKNAPIWQAEVARRNAPMVIPGGNPLGAAFNLLFNPQAFLDGRNYSYAAPGNGDDDRYDGAEATHRFWSQPPQCAAGMDDTMRRTCQIQAAATYNLGGHLVYPNNPHVSDTAFAQALAATQARTQSLYGRPVLASAPQAGGGNEKNGSSGGAGTAAVGNGNPAGPGR